MAQVTVIIPTYQRPYLLRRAIESVRNQSYRDWIACVYDNASGDETEEVVTRANRIDSRIRYYRRKENLGAIRNIARAIGNVETPFFNILCDDDLLFPSFLETATGALLANPDAILFGGATVQVGPDATVTNVPLAHWQSGVYSPPEGLFEIVRHQHPDLTGTLFRREAVTRVGTLNLGFGNKCDLEFLCRCAAQFAIVISSAPCGALFAHPFSLGFLEAERDKYGPNTVAKHWIDIAASISTLDKMRPGDRATARRMIMNRVRGVIFRRACKAAAAGRTQEVSEALSLMSAHFRPALATLAVQALQFVAKGPLIPALTSTVEAARKAKAVSPRAALTRGKLAEYEKAVRDLLNSVAVRVVD